jgi:hypothetical protein
MARKAGQIVARGASAWLVGVYPKIRTYSFATGVTGRQLYEMPSIRQLASISFVDE